MATKIKICGVRDAGTADAALALGADFIGLVLTPSRRQIGVEAAQQIIRALPQGRFVAVGQNVDETLFEEMLGLGVWGVQLHGRTPRDWVRRAHQRQIRALATWLNPEADVVLLDGVEPGSGKTRDWQRPSWPRDVWIAGGLSPDNVRQVVREVAPNGVDVSSGVEVDGTKSVVRIQRFIEEVRHGDDEKRA
ncbi:phosphoribosylanthranilate isomerase [Sulfobacillus harzensis]|uniref:N-(5'-phosphoribosyl)anthranilate isomerase n=1 Tax=Sulfobacillus harzensis TaxID=2729629 RepID=A0A7Y0L3A9_9FIRM|nr:phosphoribosylanthranilate isomerase [Sulfobacillus harzensis]